MQQFENSTEVSAEIPGQPTKRIHESAIKAWTVTSGLFGLMWFIPAGVYVGISVNHIDWLLFSAILVISLSLYLLTVLVWPKLRWRRWKYDVSAREIDMLRGIIFQKRTLVPINRVQHVDTRHGPVYRKFGLSSVTISTAATTHEIPALDNATADELRNTISILVRKVKEDV